ncbi:MAG TPA: class I SAM-dependent methyltransferase [Anaeromyxobacteraceae bacterium]|nr:class I SAM-dependent methyltransferase [Anaeromyxobacteraceae bacterium]
MRPVPGIDQTPWAYDAMMALSELRGLGRWRRWLAGGARGLTLEVGCGTGRNLALYPAGARLVAVDPARQNLSRARRRGARVPLVQASAEALPFRSGTFDTVVSSLVFCSVPDPARGLAEVRRVLEPGGALRMMEHVRSRHRLWARVQDRIQPAWTWLAGGCHPNRDTERTVEAAGFRIEEEGRRARGNMRRFQARLPRP